MEPNRSFLTIPQDCSNVYDEICQRLSKDEIELCLDMKMSAEFERAISAQGEGPRPAVKWKNTSALERQNFMTSFVMKIGTIEGDIRSEVLDQVVDSCASAVNATGRSLYLTDEDAKKIWRYIPDTKKPVNVLPMKGGTTLASFVATTKETVVTSHVHDDQRFPEGLGLGNNQERNLDRGLSEIVLEGRGKNPSSLSVLCQPILLPNGKLCGVIELTRSGDAVPFTDNDVQVVNGFLIWGGTVLHYAQKYQIMHKEKRLNEFLLNVSKSIFQDMVSVDAVISKILNFAQTLVDADGTSLFLVDSNTNELYAKVFSVGNDRETRKDNQIRFSRSKGIAGHVATTGETLNIPDAYEDPRFNRDVDIKTGYKTRTILCMPIFIHGNIIGVVQMVNKKQGVFTSNDEKAFHAFADYCGLALHHAKLYETIRRSEQKHKITLGVLSYHSTCTESEINELKQLNTKYTMDSMLNYNLNQLDIESTEMAHFAIKCFEDIYDLDNRYDINKLFRFVLTVRKNYRDVPYHNWRHGFTVAHTMYCLIKNSKGIFSGLEAVALYVACLCHDLDHRGRNNAWMIKEHTPLASIYTTSTLEHHHFDQTVTILEHEGHNIFSHFSTEEYKTAIGLIRDCILATDLVSFFGNRAKLASVVKAGEFQWNNSDHRKMARALSMTSCDLSSCAKPWDVQYETVGIIYKEFYAQGDEEKAHGRLPDPMMDRATADNLPNYQVGFLDNICIPAYALLTNLIDGGRPLLDGAQENRVGWTKLVGDVKSKEKDEGE